ncbi:MAG TPA: hypothetical protein VFP54_07070 [Acidimicrobiales bacterium]|nr:hypothetical protein [Acidimicrobiales bacterium]
MTTSEDLVPLIGPWMSRQRWAARGEADLSSVTLVDSEEIPGDGPQLWWLLVRGGTAVYQVPLAVRPAADPPDVGETAVLGAIEDDTPLVVYDATADGELVLRLADQMGIEGVAGERVRFVGAEQSNTSLVIGERIILKLFRKLQAGRNPDVEVTTALDEVGFNHIASPVAVWRRGEFDLAVAQEFLAGGTEGWALALTSLRDLYACADEDPAAAGGDFASESRRLGEMTARLHLAMSEAFATSPSDPERWIADLRRRADGAEPEVIAAVDRVAGAVEALGDVGPSTRVHGDYHLGQVMRTVTGWFVLDFEGEPARPLEDRRAPWPPLRDVAGMLRSLDYAAAVALGERDADARPALAERGRAWVERNREAFLDGYFGVEGIEALLPPGAGAQAVIAFFELDKALYELDYEKAHRPDWVSIPKQAIERLAAGYDAGDGDDGHDEP